MEDQAKFQRMLEILMMISGSFGYSVEQIASKYKISERTAYRYLTTFQNAGFLLDKTNGHFKINKSSSQFKDLSKLIHFSEEEAYILSRAIHLIDDENKFKHTLYEKLYYLFDSEKAVNKLVKKESSESVIKLKDAVNNKELVVLKGYRSSNSDNIRDRLIEPFDFSPNYNYVWCYDLEDKENKTFKIARIKAVSVTGKKWKNEKKHRKRETDVFRISGNNKKPIKFILSLMAYNLLVEEYPLSEKFIKKGAEGKYIFDGWVCDFKGVGRFILGLSGEIEVMKPNQLRTFLQEKIRANNFKN